MDDCLARQVANVLHLHLRPGSDLGVVFDIDPAQKPRLDVHEGLGHGYAEQQISVIIDLNGNLHTVFMYAAEDSHIDPALRPYSWYKRFVLAGALEHYLPEAYIASLNAVDAIVDPDKTRTIRIV
jgi:hypothetical protein